MDELSEMERRLNRLPTKRWWLVRLGLAVTVCSAIVVFADTIKALATN